MSLDVVEFRWNGSTLPSDLIKSYGLTHDIFKGASLLTMDIAHEVAMGLTKDPQLLTMSINGYPVFRGFVDRIERKFSKTSYSQMLYARDMTQILVDNYVLNPKTYPKSSFKTIINDIWNTSRKITSIKKMTKSGAVKTYPISSILSKSTALNLYPLQTFYTPDAEKLLTAFGDIEEYSTRPKMTLFDAISELANHVGLYLYHCAALSEGPETIVFQISSNPSPRDPTGTPISFLMDGNHSTFDPYRLYNYIDKDKRVNNNVISGEFSTDITNYYKYTRLMGDSGSATSWNPGVAKTGKVFGNINTYLRNDFLLPDQYTGVVKFKVEVENRADTKAWFGTDELINNILLTQNRALHNLKYVVRGLSPNGDYPYFPNHLCEVSDDWIPGLDKQKFMIYKVGFNGSKTDGLKTELELCLPGPFNDDLLWV